MKTILNERYEIAQNQWDILDISRCFVGNTTSISWLSYQFFRYENVKGKVCDVYCILYTFYLGTVASRCWIYFHWRCDLLIWFPQTNCKRHSSRKYKTHSCFPLTSSWDSWWVSCVSDSSANHGLSVEVRWGLGELVMETIQPEIDIV